MAERSGQKVQEVNFQAGYFMEVGLGRLMVGGPWTHEGSTRVEPELDCMSMLGELNER